MHLGESWENLVLNLVRNDILKSPDVIRAMRLVPRELFVPESHASMADIDTPLPIGEGQTISAPHS